MALWASPFPHFSGLSALLNSKQLSKLLQTELLGSQQNKNQSRMMSSHKSWMLISSIPHSSLSPNLISPSCNAARLAQTRVLLAAAPWTAIPAALQHKTGSERRRGDLLCPLELETVGQQPGLQRRDAAEVRQLWEELFVLPHLLLVQLGVDKDTSPILGPLWWKRGTALLNDAPVSPCTCFPWAWHGCPCYRGLDPLLAINNHLDIGFYT